MLTLRRITVAAVVLFVALAAQAQAPQHPEGGTSHDGMPRIDSKRFALAWVAEDAHFGEYTKLLVLPPALAYKRPPKKGNLARENFALTDIQVKRLRDAAQDAFTKQLVEKGDWELTQQPGPDVMIVRGALIDLVVNLPPPRAGRGHTYVDSFGEGTLVVEFFDSQSGQILARIADRRAAEPAGDRMGIDIEAAGEVRRMFSVWAKRLREALDEAKRLKP